MAEMLTRDDWNTRNIKRFVNNENCDNINENDNTVHQ